MDTNIVPPPLAAAVANIAATSAGIQYHEDDPHRELIETAARAHGLVCCPSPSIEFRKIRGCVPPPPVDNTPVGALIAAMDKATATAAARFAGSDPTPAERRRVHAEQILAALHAFGWRLTAVDGPGGDPQ